MIDFGKYLSVKPVGDDFVVRLSVGPQSFTIGHTPFDVEGEAEWFREMFIKALKVIEVKDRAEKREVKRGLVEEKRGRV